MLASTCVAWGGLGRTFGRQCRCRRLRPLFRDLTSGRPRGPSYHIGGAVNTLQEKVPVESVIKAQYPPAYLLRRPQNRSAGHGISAAMAA